MNKIKWFFENLFNALFNDKQGFSIRKCMAIVMVKITIMIELMNVNDKNLVSVLYINLGFVSLLIGLVTFQNLIELKNGKTV
jgi:hypothetical protein